MAKAQGKAGTRAARSVILIPPQDAAAEAGGEEERPDILAQLRDEQEGYLVIRRLPEPGSVEEPEIVGRFDAGLFPTLDHVPDFLRDHYGAGRYQVRGRNRKGQWIGSAWTIKVAAPLKAGGAPAAAAVPAVVAAAPQPQQDRTALWIQLAGIVTPIVTAIIERPAAQAPQGLSVTDMVTLVSLNKPQSIADVLAAMKSVRELLDDGAEPAPPTGATTADLIMKAISEGGKILPQLMGRAPMPPQPGPSPGLPAPAAAPAADAGAVPEQPGPVQTENEFIVLARILQRAAASGKKPDAYAMMVAEHLGDEVALALLQQPAPADVIVAMGSAQGLDVSAHKDWLAQLLAEVKKLYEEDPAEGAEAGKGANGGG